MAIEVNEIQVSGRPDPAKVDYGLQLTFLIKPTELDIKKRVESVKFSCDAKQCNDGETRALECPASFDL
jgi:hypothetical protein